LETEVQRARARWLRGLHDRNDPLVLPNIWDPLGARILEAEGYPAVATSSSAIAALFGYRDGERLSRETTFEWIRRITSSVRLPVTADIERGFAETEEELAESVHAILDTGVSGINLEDSIVERVERRSIDEQCTRIRTAREVADGRRIPLVINARIDTFLDPEILPDEALADTLERAARYLEAGADVIYPIGPCDPGTVIQLRSGIDAPLNILVGPHAPMISVLREIGVERLSLGPFVHRATVSRLVGILQGLRDDGDYAGFGGDDPTEKELSDILRDRPEGSRNEHPATDPES